MHMHKYMHVRTCQVALYVDGARLTNLRVPLRPTPATYPVTVNWRLWPDSASLLVAPRYASTHASTNAASHAMPPESARLDGGWSGSLLMLAAYAAALTEAQVRD